MGTLKKSVLESKIMEMLKLTGSKHWYAEKALRIIDQEVLALMYENLKKIPETQRKSCFIKMLKELPSYNWEKSTNSLTELVREFARIVDSACTKNEVSEMPLSETNGVDISGCQCFTCKHKDDKETLEGYYTGAYEAYKEAIELVREAFPDDKSADWLKIKSLLSKLGYEKDCSGALLEEASYALGKERNPVKVFTIDGTIQTSAKQDEDKVSDMIIKFMEENGFSFSGRIEFLEAIPEPEEEKAED